MSRIKGSNTKPEILVRKYLFAQGFRYKLHDKKLPGRPDLVLPKYRVAIFVHGCFWHGHHACKYFIIPKTRTQWWTDKINSNKVRDTVSMTLLEKANWRVYTIWECELSSKQREITLLKLVDHLNSLKVPA